jgi:hypothetical protein
VFAAGADGIVGLFLGAQIKRVEFEYVDQRTVLPWTDDLVVMRVSLVVSGESADV